MSSDESDIDFEKSVFILSRDNQIDMEFFDDIEFENVRELLFNVDGLRHFQMTCNPCGHGKRGAHLIGANTEGSEEGRAVVDPRGVQTRSVYS